MRLQFLFKIPRLLSHSVSVRPDILSAIHRAPYTMVTRPLKTDVTINTPRDPNTLSNYNNFVTTHVAASFDVDFEKKKLVGSVVLNLKSVTDAETEKIILDTRYAEAFHSQVTSLRSLFSSHIFCRTCCDCRIVHLQRYGALHVFRCSRTIVDMKSKEREPRHVHATIVGSGFGCSGMVVTKLLSALLLIP